MNPILKKLQQFFAFQRVIGDDTVLKGRVLADNLLQNLVHQKKIPGIAITVLKKGELFFQNGYGYADIEAQLPADPKTSIFRIASISKNIAAVALAHMVEEGSMDLDASFYTYVPYYPKKKWDFTIRQLAGHTAGIRGYRGMEYGLNKAYTIKEGSQLVADDDLLFEPGTDYLYTSFSWVLISLAMQEVSGIPFEAYVQEYVLDPLQLMATRAPEGSDAILKPRLSTEKGIRPHTYADFEVTKFYTKKRIGGFRNAIQVNNHYKLAGGGYLSTSENIAFFGQALLEGKLFTENTAKEFLTAQLIRGRSTYYGLGWQVSLDQKGRDYYGHVGNGVGGYANFLVYPKEQMVFSMLTNCTNPEIQGELDEILDVLQG